MLKPYSFKYFSLVSKETNEEVYTSPDYKLDNSDVTDYDKVFDRFKFYFDRINSGIKQQLESPRTSEEQKKTLKYIGPNDFKFSYMELTNDGGYQKTRFWTKDVESFDTKYCFT